MTGLLLRMWILCNDGPGGDHGGGDYDNNALTTLQSSASSLNSMQLLLSSSCPGLDNYRFKSYMVIQPQSFQLVFVLTNQLQMSIVLSKTWKSSAKVTKKYKVNFRGQK